MRLERLRRPARLHPAGHPETAAPAPRATPLARLGTLAGVTAGGAPLVTAPGWLDVPVEATLAAAPPGATLAAAIGGGVVLLAVEGEPARPVIVGWVQHPAPPGVAADLPAERVLRVDGERVVISAEQELELRCGKASVTLTADGRVLIRGRGILTHARELNRIRGGQVRIN